MGSTTIKFKNKDVEEKAVKAVFSNEDLKKHGIEQIHDLFGDTNESMLRLWEQAIIQHHNQEVIAEKLGKANLNYCVYVDFRKFAAYDFFDIYSAKGNLHCSLDKYYYFSDASGIFSKFKLSQNESKQLLFIATCSAANNLPYDYLTDIDHFPGKNKRATLLTDHNSDPTVYEYTEEDNKLINKYFNMVEEYKNTLYNIPLSTNEIINKNFDIILGINA